MSNQSPLPSDPSFLPLSLDDLLAESMTERNLAQQVKGARTALAIGGLPKADSEALTATVRSFEAKREWNPAASVVMFSRQKCRGCGQFHTQFTGFFQRQVHRTSRLERWIPWHKPTDDKLPRESKYADAWAEMCEDCAEHAGFEVEGD